MWEKIKSFFKWVADHTGISWIARKISSGWKWLFGGSKSQANATQQNASQQKRSSNNEEQEPAQTKTTTSETLDDQVDHGQPTAAPDEPQGQNNTMKPIKQYKRQPCYFEATQYGLLLVTTDKGYKFLAEKCQNTNQNNKTRPREFRVFVNCGNENFCITGSYSLKQDTNNEKKSLPVNSVKRQNSNGSESSDLSGMMCKLGLDENRKSAEITRVSQSAFAENHSGVPSSAFSSVDLGNFKTISVNC